MNTAKEKPLSAGQRGHFQSLARAFNWFQLGASMTLLAVILLLLAGGVVPALFGAETFAVYSGSMEPAIRVGSLAVVRPARPNELKPGDVITYRAPDAPDVVVTHRLVGFVTIEQDGQTRLQYRTKGDANDVEDLVLVDQRAVLGKVIYSVPFAGYIAEFAKSDPGKLLFLGLPALVLSLDLARERWRRRRTEATATATGRSEATTNSPDVQAATLRALLERGQQALASGYLELAEQAADAVLNVDARNEEAWILKAQSAATVQAKLDRLQTALVLNPGSERVAAMLEALRDGRSAAAV